MNPRQPGLGLLTSLNLVPTAGEKPSGRAPWPVAVQRGMISGSVKARQTFAGGCGYSRVMRMPLIESYRPAARPYRATASGLNIARITKVHTKAPQTDALARSSPGAYTVHAYSSAAAARTAILH